MLARGADDRRGKLRAVARNWVEGRGGRASTEGDPLTAASGDEIARRAGLGGDPCPEIGEEDAPAVELFLSLTTQWRHDALSGRPLGIDYSAIPATATMLDIRHTPELMHSLRIMEHEALARKAARR